MSEFNSPFDIGVRALQRVGAPISPAGTNAAFPGGTKAAGQLLACYGKLRRAELRRSIWTFATRRTAIRPLDTNTLKLAPSLWGSSVTYFAGSIVSDANGTFWQSTIPNNLNNEPGKDFKSWRPYFGPMSVSLYDSSQAYYAGENVYTAAGDGTYNVFSSLLNGNQLHPALPNQWSADTTYFKDNVVQRFPAWSSLTTYSKGAGALYTDGNVYVSLVNGNLNLAPSSNPASWVVLPVVTLTTQQVPEATFGATSQLQTTPINEWNIEASYALGDFIIFNAAVYVSLQGSNTGQFPNATSSAYWAAVTGGALWQSLVDLNLGNDPSNTAAAWASGTSYVTNDLVSASDGFTYKAIANSTGKDPSNGGNPASWTEVGYTAWASSFVAGGGNSQWTQIGGSAFPSGVGLSGFNITYPIGCGPASNSMTKNVYPLPANFLRRCPQEPKAGVNSWLGAPANRRYDDWLFEGNFLITQDGGTIIFRFVADVQNVSDFDDMFCEALGCRVALEICEPLTQSTAKVALIAKEYDKFMGDAIIVGGIEAGFEESPLDEYIACRA